MRVVSDPVTGELLEVLPNEVHEQEPYDYGESKVAVMNASRERRGAEMEYRNAVDRKAKAEREYRRVLSVEVMKAKVEHGATVAEMIAKGTDTVGLAKEEALAAEGQVRAALERMQLCSEDRASLHRLIEWSRELQGGPQ
jgi:hypothetical protein